MQPDLKTWTCGHCQRTILVPSECGGPAYVDSIQRIREHWFGHLVEVLDSASDEEIWRLCDDEPAQGSYSSSPHEPVDSDDVTPVLEGITKLLRDDLPRAKRLWYPINEDGSFNR